MKISQILHKAADEYLWDGVKDKNVMSYSCAAVGICMTYHGCSAKQEAKVIEFLDQLGCPLYSMEAFDEFETYKDRQGARYLWLKFAALVAEEEGI